MRLIRKQIYRAFPELDRFGDEQCVRFVVAANASWTALGIRWLIVAGLGAAAAVVGVVAGVLVLAWLDPGVDRWWSAIIAVPAFVIVTLAGMVLALVARDGMLRMQVRRVFRTCGSCVSCRYSLIGIPVGKDLRVTCPECGSQRTVDPSLGELVVSESGASVYRPEGAPVYDEEMERRAVRRRRILKRLGVVAAGAVGLLAITYGGWWVFLIVQSRAARAQPGMWSEIAAARKAGKIGGGGADTSQSKAEWDDYLKILGEVAGVEAGIAASPNHATKRMAFAYMDPESLRGSATAAAYEKNRGAGTFIAVKAFTQDVVDENAAATSPEKLDRMHALLGAFRPAPASGGAAFDATKSGTFWTWSVASYNRARMVVALQSQSRDEYFRAMDQCVDMIVITDRQGLLMDAVAAMGLRRQLIDEIIKDQKEFPADAWKDAARESLVRMGEGPGLADGFETSRFVVRESIGKVFADPMQAQRAMVGVMPDEYQQYMQFAKISVKPLEVGTYWSNMAANDVAHDRLVGLAKQEAWERPKSNFVACGLPLVDWSTTWDFPLLVRDDGMRREYRRELVVLTAEEFRRREGRAPASIEEIKSMLPTARTGFDPFMNKPFEIQTAAAGKGAFEVVAPSDGKEPAAKH